MKQGSFTSNTVSSINSSYPRSIKVDWKSTPNTAANTSTLNYTISTPTGTATNWVYAYSIKVVINGTTIYNTTSQTKIYGSKTLKTGSLTISHNSNGSKSVNVSISAALYSSSINSTYSGNITLDTIARASSISAATNKTLGSACSISWTPASSTFTYKIKFSLGSKSHTTGTISPNRTTSYTYTGYTIDTNTFAPAIPNATTGTMTATLYTYSGSTQIGTSSKTFTVTVPSNVIPTLNTPSVTIDNSANATVKGWGVAVAGYTKAKVTANASGAQGATINSFTITGGYSVTQNGTSLSYTGSYLTSGSKTFTVTAKDSRGRISSSKTTSAITVYAYSKPAITTFSVDRNTSSPTKMIAKANWSFAAINSKNTATATLSYKKSSATSWTTYGTIAKNTNITLAQTFEEKSSYDFKIEVTDALSNTAKRNISVSTTKVTMDFRAGGNGIAIGKMCEKDGFEVAMPMYIKNGVYPVHILLESDLNDYHIPGTYSGGDASSMLNSPTTAGAAFVLEIYRAGSSTLRLQRLTTTANGNTIVYERYYNGSVWWDWNCVSRSSNPILWSGTGLYMTDTHTVNLSEPISKQVNGIILTFAPYYISPDETTATAKTWDNIDIFVSKGSVTGSVKDFPLAAQTFSIISIKKLKITDTQIIGDSSNNTKGTTNGITWDNTKFVLTKVTGC